MRTSFARMQLSSWHVKFSGVEKRYQCSKCKVKHCISQGPSREEDPLKQLADKLRAKNGIEWRSSVLHDQRVEFIRGKDLARYLRSHEEQLQPFVSKGAQHCISPDCFQSRWHAACVCCADHLRLETRAACRRQELHINHANPTQVPVGIMNKNAQTCSHQYCTCKPQGCPCALQQASRSSR